MRRKKIPFSDIAGFFIVSIAGCIGHFIYDLSGKSPLTAVLTPVNESTWEHLKLLFFPFLFYILAEFFIYGKHISGFIFSCTIGILCGMIFIPCAFHLVTAVFGKSSFLVNIAIYFISVFIAFKVRTYRIENNCDKGKKRTVPGLIILFCMTVLFAGFTYFPPESPLFENPVSE